MLDFCFQSILVNETTATFSPAAFLACTAASLALGIVIAVIFMYRNTYTNKVLQNDKHGADSYQLQNAESAFFQHTQAGRITNAGKKHRHKKSLQRCIQRQMPKASGRHDQIQQRKQNAADNRSRDTVLVKNIEPAF